MIQWIALIILLFFMWNLAFPFEQEKTETFQQDNILPEQNETLINIQTPTPLATLYHSMFEEQPITNNSGFKLGDVPPELFVM